jgi:hypothetical protein
MAALGVGGGYAYAGLHASDPHGAGAGVPAAASGPSYPSTPQDPSILPDPDDPPLAEDVELVDATLGEPGTGINLQVPKGWVRTNQPSGTEARWTFDPFGDSPYSVRVSLVDDRHTPPYLVAAKLAQLPLDPRIRDLKVVEQDDDSAVFTYVFSRKKIEQVDRYVSLTGGPTDVEIATSGRFVDDPGMRALVARMVDSLELIPTAEKSGSTQTPQ